MSSRGGDTDEKPQKAEGRPGTCARFVTGSHRATAHIAIWPRAIDSEHDGCCGGDWLQCGPGAIERIEKSGGGV